MNEELNNYFVKIVDALKARQTINIFFSFTMITLTGYAIQNNKSDIFLLASTIPILAFYFDTLIKYRYITPFLYKAFILQKGDKEESISLLYLGYGKKQYSGYLEIYDLIPGIDRQKAFRKKYIFDRIVMKVLIYSIGIVGEIILWVLLK